jgi:uncharacterized membrane protein
MRCLVSGTVHTSSMLPPNILFILAICVALGSGVMGGLLFAFSNFVMTALAHQPPASGIRAMQAINIYILNPLFVIVFFGTAVASFLVAAMTILRGPRTGGPLLLAGAALYLIGTIGVTMAFNVPLNDRLAALNPETAAAADYWLTYLSEWMKWNHVRTIASVTASLFLILAIRQLRFTPD